MFPAPAGTSPALPGTPHEPAGTLPALAVTPPAPTGTLLANAGDSPAPAGTPHAPAGTAPAPTRRKRSGMGFEKTNDLEVEVRKIRNNSHKRFSEKI